MDFYSIIAVKSPKIPQFSLLLYKNFSDTFLSPKAKSPNLNFVVGSINGYAVNIRLSMFYVLNKKAIEARKLHKNRLICTSILIYLLSLRSAYFYKK